MISVEELAQIIEKLIEVLRQYGLSPLLEEIDLEPYEVYRKEHPREDA